MRTIFLILTLGLINPFLNASETVTPLVLQLIPNYEAKSFNKMVLVRTVIQESPFSIGQKIHLWNGSQSNIHTVKIKNISNDDSNKYWPKIIIEYDREIGLSFQDNNSRLCPMPNINFSMTRAIDRRGEIYQLASVKPIPKQSWKCASITKSKITNLFNFSKFETKEWAGFSKLIMGDKSVIYQASDMNYPCKTLFIKEKSSGFEIIKELKDCNLEPFVDLDGDGMPEFLNPFSDSSDAFLKQIFPTERELATYSTGQ